MSCVWDPPLLWACIATSTILCSGNLPITPFKPRITIHPRAYSSPSTHLDIWHRAEIEIVEIERTPEPFVKISEHILWIRHTSRQSSVGVGYGGALGTLLTEVAPASTLCGWL